MARKIWESGKISIIVLPSGKQGNAILDLAQEWSRSWLLTPALWLLADEIPEFESFVDIDTQVPPTLNAYLLGRDLEQNSVREEVDVFWTLGSQPFDKVRFIAVRTEQNPDLMQKTTVGAETAARFIERAIPQRNIDSKDGSLKSYFNKFNLVISPTNERGILQGVLSTFWDANLIAAAEDRATPLSTDSFVKVSERFVGFALAHIATTAGLWAGLPISSAEISDERSQLRQARLQRVFVRGVTSDTLSADVAHWALQKLNRSDANFEIGTVEGHGVMTISSENQQLYIERLVDFILKGSQESIQGDNFLFKKFESAVLLPSGDSRLKKYMQRIADMADAMISIPEWIAANAKYRLDYALDEEYNDDILYKAIPKRMAPQVKLPPVDVLIASLKPKIDMPKPDLWRFVRESISASIDAPSSNHPEVLKDGNGKFLVFATVEQVLPNPDAFWSSSEFKDGTAVKFEDVAWLDASTAHSNLTNIQNRLDELEPGIVDARAQLSETQKLVDDANTELRTINEDLDLIKKELTSDSQVAGKIKSAHTHKLPRAITENAKRKSEGGSDYKNTIQDSRGDELEGFLSSEKKFGFWRKIFRRKKRGGE